MNFIVLIDEFENNIILPVNDLDQILIAKQIMRDHHIPSLQIWSGDPDSWDCVKTINFIFS